MPLIDFYYYGIDLWLLIRIDVYNSCALTRESTLLYKNMFSHVQIWAEVALNRKDLSLFGGGWIMGGVWWHLVMVKPKIKIMKRDDMTW